MKMIKIPCYLLVYVYGLSHNFTEIPNTFYVHIMSLTARHTGFDASIRVILCICLC